MASPPRFCQTTQIESIARSNIRCAEVFQMQLRSNIRFCAITLAALVNSTTINPALAAPAQSDGTYRNQIAYASVTPCPDLQAARLIATTFFESEDYRDSMLLYQSIC